MRLPSRVVDICWQLYNKHKDLAHGNDDQRRELTRKIAEQCRFDLGIGWGTKKAGQNNPPSKDAIAFNDASTGILWSWDWQNGVTREPQVVAFQEGEDITGQVFIVVPPINHLGSSNPIPEPEPEPEPPNNPPNDDEINQKLDALIFSHTQQNEALRAIVIALAQMNERMNPPYKGRVPTFGGNITLNPDE